MFQIGILSITCKNLATLLRVTALHTFLCTLMDEHIAFYLPEHEFYKRGRFRSTLTPVGYVRIWYVRSADVRCICVSMAACALVLTYPFAAAVTV
jgi:hypothetical protein